MANKKQPDLESAMQALEALVVRMESGELSLEESLTAFEQGMALSRQCQQALETAEQRVRILMEKSANAPLAEFEKHTTQDDSAPADSSDFDDKLPF